jgi:hypothetical protein
LSIDTSNTQAEGAQGAPAERRAMHEPMRLTVVTSTTPASLAKRLTRRDDGTVAKKPPGSPAEGRVEVVEVAGLAGFATLREQAARAGDVAFCYGTPFGVTRARLVTQDREAATSGAIARTRERFGFQSAPAVLMIDHDPTPGVDSLPPEALHAALAAVIPGFRDTPALWTPSSSSGVTPAGDESSAAAVGGQRLYVGVADGSLIPQAMKAIEALLWAAGHGVVVSSKAGTAQYRTLVDVSTGQPERLDYVADPVIGDGLARRVESPRFFGPSDGPLLDLRVIIAAVDGDVRRRANGQRAAALQRAAGALAETRERWLADRAPALAAARGISVVQARRSLSGAADSNRLDGDFVLFPATGGEVTVAEVLADPAEWHGTRFADPLEPDYGNDPRIARADLTPGRVPRLYSHAHGGRSFRLDRHRREVQHEAGDLSRITHESVQALRERGGYYNRGSDLVQVIDDAASIVIRDRLALELAGGIALYKLVRGQQGPRRVPMDIPPAVPAAVLALGADRDLARLTAVVTVPTARADGSIVDEPGHDAESGVLYAPAVDPAPRVPRAASVDDALAALRVLNDPIREFPFATPVDRAVALAAMLTAIVRPSIDTAPAFGFSAPAAGSGKTRLAEVVGAIATGRRPAVTPPVEDDDEARKRALAAARGGEAVWLIDNVARPFGSEALDALITSGRIRDRILGLSEEITVDARFVLLATGNGLVARGDTSRRILISTIDAKCERPAERRFGFDPVALTIARRTELAVAGLTIMRAWVTAGRPRGGAAAGSFEQWDDLVREPLRWLSEVVRRRGDPTLPEIDDPLLAIDRAHRDDPEEGRHVALMLAWFGAFGERGVTIADALRFATHGEAGFERADGAETIERRLLHAMREAASRAGAVDTRALGGYLRSVAGRPLHGLQFEQAGMTGGTARWRVLPVGALA